MFLHLIQIAVSVSSAAPAESRKWETSWYLFRKLITAIAVGYDFAVRILISRAGGV